MALTGARTTIYHIIYLQSATQLALLLNEATVLGKIIL